MAKKLSRKHFLAGAAPVVAAAPFVHSACSSEPTPRARARRTSARPRPRDRGPRGDDRRGGALDRAQPRDRRAALAAAGAAAPAGPGARVRPARRSTRRSRSRRASPSPPGRTTAPRPGPVIRATEDDLLRVKFVNGGSHPHTIHFHGIHPANMDGVFEIVEPGRVVHVRVPGAAVRDAPLPLPRDAAEEAHPQGPLRRLHHRPARSRASRRRSS